VTVSGAPTATAGASTPRLSPTTASAPAHTTGTLGAGGTPSTATPGQQGTSTTRTAPAPAFLHAGTSAEQVGASAAAAAEAVVAAHGYTATDSSLYHPNQTLRVLIGTRSGSAGGYDQRAFFFLDNRYLGTDASAPSASLSVAGQSDTEVTLAYALYRPHDALCCPSGGRATVRFQLDNGRLVALDPLPPASSATGLARQ
jgi:hypothetical protein